MTQTKFAKDKSPWAGTAWERKGIEMNNKTRPEPQVMPEANVIPGKRKTAEKPINVSKLIVTNDPVQMRRKTPSKYDAVFNKLPMGHCIVCEPHEASRIGATLTKWLKTKGRKGSVKSVSHYERDGKGRVWLLEE